MPDQQPSEAELAILQALWQQQPASVREVHEIISRQRDVGYTTVLKQLQRMLDKGLVRRESRGKTHYYQTKLTQESVQRDLLDRLADTAFGGSAIRLALRALGSDRPSPEELDELQRRLDELKNRS
jgi:BlaI family transcriptional regulator, penicillinase repressor